MACLHNTNKYALDTFPKFMDSNQKGTMTNNIVSIPRR